MTDDWVERLRHRIQRWTLRANYWEARGNRFRREWVPIIWLLLALLLMWRVFEWLT